MISNDETRRRFIGNQKAIFNQTHMFMSPNGYCEYCRRYIVDVLLSKGNDGTKLVTGCPLCHASFCD